MIKHKGNFSSKSLHHNLLVCGNNFKHKLLNNIENNIFSNPLNSIMTKKYEQSLKDDEILCFYFYKYKANFSDNYVDKISKIVCIDERKRADNV